MKRLGKKCKHPWVGLAGIARIVAEDCGPPARACKWPTAVHLRQGVGTQNLGF